MFLPILGSQARIGVTTNRLVSFTKRASAVDVVNAPLPEGALQAPRSDVEYLYQTVMSL